jgi:hypothetical protein
MNTVLSQRVYTFMWTQVTCFFNFFSIPENKALVFAYET